jgi:hypothetical protein
LGLKRHLSGQRFLDDEVVVPVTTWLQALEDFFANGFNILVSRREKYLNKGGDYVEK